MTTTSTNTTNIISLSKCTYVTHMELPLWPNSHMTSMCINTWANAHGCHMCSCSWANAHGWIMHMLHRHSKTHLKNPLALLETLRVIWHKYQSCNYWCNYTKIKSFWAVLLASTTRLLKVQIKLRWNSTLRITGHYLLGISRTENPKR